MSLPVLQGLGDGVVIFLGIIVALVVIVFAWWSTNVAETRVVGVIYLSTSHFNRLLQHLRQTPAPAPGHSGTFLTPSVDHNSDSVDALSVARSVPASGNPIHDIPPTSVDVKRDETSSVPGVCSDQSVDTQDDTRSSHLQECSVATSRDVCVDAQTAGSHLHSDNCTDLGRLHSTPRGMVLEGCTHMDGRMVDGWWTEASMDHVDDERANSVVQTIQQPTNPTTNRQHWHHNTDITDIGSSSYLAQASRNVHENHEGESDEDGHTLSGGHGGVDDTLEAAQSDDNNVQQNTTSCRACLNLPGASSVSSRDQNTNTASKIYNHELRECGEFTDMNKAFEENVASVTSSESLLATGESIAVSCSNPTDTVLTRNVLRTRQVQAGYVTVRLKYLDDQQRDVQTRLEDTVADFKRQHFAAELSANCTVRFVHNGQELRGDTATLRSFNVVDKSVIHCWLSRPAPPASAAGTGSSSVAAATQLDFGCLVLPLLAMLLLLVWYCRFSYHIYFSAVSTFCLVAMTLVFAVCMFVSQQFGDDAIDEVAM